MSTPNAAVPSALARLLDGRNVDGGVGHTLLLVATGRDGWPHVAMLSVGEVLVAAPDRLRLAVHEVSGTCDALRASGRALLHTVVDGVVVRVWASCRELPESPSGGLAAFAARVERVKNDEVAYARVRHGIEYELTEAPSVLARWRRQIDWLARLPE